MYNYANNGVTLDAKVMETIQLFEGTARILAMESVEHTTQKKALEETMASYVKDEKTEEAKAIQLQIEALDDAWSIRQKALNFALYGGKDDKGEKSDGICGIVTDDLYKAYVAMIKDGKNGEYRHAMYEFCKTLINGDTIKDGAFNHFYNDIKTTMSSAKYNSNSQIAQGATFITTINKRTYKRMLLGSICDIVSNNKTLKIKKDKKNNK